MSLAAVGADGILRFRNQTLRAAIGRAGLSAHKQEGDGATPAGLLPLRRVLYRADSIARPHASVPTEPLCPQDGWCDEPGDPAYNRAVRLPYAGRHEALWRSDGSYDLIGVLGWNDGPVEKSRGSAIFLHCAAPDLAPTEGCVALARDDLARLLEAGLTGLRVGQA